MLSLVGMLRAVVNVYVLQQLSAQAGLGQHALDNLHVQGMHTFAEVFLPLALGLQLSRGRETLATGIASVANILVLGPLLASHLALVSVDDDDVVATINVRSVVGFVLATEDLSHLRAQATQDLVGSINYHPFLLYGFGICRNGFVT